MRALVLLLCSAGASLVCGQEPPPPQVYYEPTPTPTPTPAPPPFYKQIDWTSRSTLVKIGLGVGALLLVRMTFRRMSE